MSEKTIVVNFGGNITARTEQDALRHLGRAGDDVREGMDAVAEVDVDRPALAPEHRIARCTALMGVTGLVLGAAVGLGLGDALAQLRPVRETVDEDLPHERRGDREAVSLKKRRIEPSHRTAVHSSSRSASQRAVSGLT